MNNITLTNTRGNIAGHDSNFEGNDRVKSILYLLYLRL